MDGPPGQLSSMPLAPIPSMTRPFIRAVLLDLSGTLHVGSTPTTPDAVSALRHLRASGVPIRFCTNTSKESTAKLEAKLKGIGFEVDAKELWTSLGAVRRTLREKGLTRPYLLLSESAKEEFADVNCQLPANESAGPHHDCVVVGLAPSMFTYEHLDCAFRVLKGEQPKIAPAPNGCPPNAPHVTEFKRIPDTSPNLEPNHLISLIATHKAKYIQSSDGALSLGPGPFVGALESATGVEAEVVGKPTRAFFETVIRSLPGQYEAPGECYDALAEEGRIAIVGDDIEADLGGGAVELGLWRVLVKTGKYRPGDESRPGVKPPDESANSFAEWAHNFHQQNRSSAL